MKRIVLFVAALACGVGTQAQNTQLEKNLEKANFVCDSIATVLAQHRADYAAQNDSIREKMAPTILSLEKELTDAKAKYEKVLAAIMQRDVERELSAYKASIKTDTVIVAEQPKVEVAQPTATVAKAYEALFNDNKQELKVAELVAQYVEKYNELLALQSQYMSVPTKQEAQEISDVFAIKRDELATLDGEIASLWHHFYYDRIYAYNLLVERSDNSNVQKFSDAAARAKIREASGKYISDALVDYYISRESLLEYEMKIATSHLLTSSSETLLSRMAELKKLNPHLSKLALERRNFIHYEDISVKTPSIYNSTNPVPKTQVEDFGTVYRIRIGSFSKKMSTSMLRGAKPVSYTYDNEEYSYFVGGFRTEAEAQIGVKRLKEIGFKEPIIAVWVDGEYYPTIEEMRRYESQYNIKISGVATLSDEIEAAIRSYNSDCEIKREGGAFVVGSFSGQESANKVAAAIKALDTEVEVEIEKQNLK